MGRLIVFEGIDHTGKTTQMDLAEKWIARREIPVERYREPGGTAVGERIREILLDKDASEMKPLTEVLLFFASRAQLIQEKVKPALDEGKTVFLDRYFYATAAYQGPFVPRGVDWVLGLAENLGLPNPDAVICLDGDPEILARRKTDGRDRIEMKGVNYQRTVRAAYHSMAVRWPGLFKLVDATRPVEEVHQDIVAVLEGMLK